MTVVRVNDIESENKLTDLFTPDTFQETLAGPETEEAHPGLIDNSHLMDPSAPCELKDNMMMKGLNYDLVPTDIWFPLQEQFGLVEGQEPIPRIVRRKYGCSVVCTG